MRHATFDRLFHQGRDAIASGTHERQVPPVANGPRWGTSVILRPDAAAADRIDALTQQALRAAGPAHWPTGARASAHLTVRALEPHRPHIPAGNPLRIRYEAALAAAAAKTGPIRFALQGLTLTPNSVMMCAHPLDEAADDFATTLAGELGADGWLEADRPRDIWYLTLVHFAGPHVNTALTDWVAQRRLLPLGDTVVTTAQLIVWQYNGHHVVPAPLATFPLGNLNGG
ncbi:hypothetical protein ACF1G0_33765 [Streptomyces sp. NPDC013953]|uniref:hypothetical protein n=1 Tax=Streptomyces sp. NPDC013953 TaxID=3364868 RepID=UPI0036FBD9BF